MLDDLDFYLILVTKPLEKLGLPLFFVNNSFLLTKFKASKIVFHKISVMNFQIIRESVCQTAPVFLLTSRMKNTKIQYSLTFLV